MLVNMCDLTLLTGSMLVNMCDLKRWQDLRYEWGKTMLCLNHFGAINGVMQGSVLYPILGAMVEWLYKAT